MSYNKDTDYQAKINDAVSKGDYESAAEYEKSRNEKIDGENLSYEKTNNYSGWLDKTDYSNVLRSQMSGGASRDAVAKTLEKRVNKAKGTQGLTQYAADDVYDAAIRYIMGTNSFSYQEKMPEFKSSYDSELKKLYRELADIKKFSYNPYEDELYDYYRRQYVREGQRAMEELLGELSANTGGVASSYAVSAAAQSQNYYNQKLTDIIPELYADAYERYLDEVSRTERNLGILTDLTEDEYSRYLDSLNQYNKNREFEYGKFLDEQEYEYRLREDERESEEAARDYDYLLKKLENEAEENSRKWKQQEYENEYESTQDKIEKALRKWENIGYLDKESAEILGLPEGLHTTDYDYKRAQQYKMYSK
jgi:hypothetical protein